MTRAEVIKLAREASFSELATRRQAEKFERSADLVRDSMVDSIIEAFAIVRKAPNHE